MPILEVSEISKSFSDGYAVESVSLTAERGEIVCLLGPSGCGKTTLLRLIAGLEEPDRGSITFDGRALNGLLPRERGFGLMFQDLALFPHMDVTGNVSFGLRMQHIEKANIRKRVDELLEMVDLAGYGHRKVHELSGGERQRVALARSLAPEPKLLMFDEPFGSLDRGLRESLQTEVRAILKTIGMTSIYVTHDRDEAFAIADSLVVMDKGSVVQAGTARELFAAPVSDLVARSLGLKNVMPGTVTTTGAETTVTSPIGTLVVGDAGPRPSVVGSNVLVLVDERQIVVRHSSSSDLAAGPDDRIVLNGVVEGLQFHGGESDLIIRIGEGRLTCLVRPDDFTTAISAGGNVDVVVPSHAVRLVPREG
jgi:ABC-type Fe3+/spermidine/putrescine transport system ATPase subunit